MLRFVAAGAIGLYQRHLSPRKGYACAWRVHTGRCSCSQYGKRLVLRAGVLALPAGMRRQFARCRAAFEAIQSARPDEAEEKKRRRKRKERDPAACGDDDGEVCGELDCGDCDVGNCEVGTCEVGSCDGGSWDPD